MEGYRYQHQHKQQQSQQQQQQQQKKQSLSALLQVASQRELKEKELSNRLHVLEKQAACNIEKLKELKDKYSKLVVEKQDMTNQVNEFKNQRDILENSLSNTQSSRMNLEQVYKTTKNELELITRTNKNDEMYQAEAVGMYKQNCKAVLDNCQQMKTTILQSFSQNSHNSAGGSSPGNKRESSD